MELEELTQKALALHRRFKVEKLQDAIIMGGLDVGAETCPVRHHFAPGQYAREMTLPAGMVVVGKIHKHAHINVISKGRVRVFTEHEGAQELCAPITFVSTPFTKRAVYVLEDTVWTTIHQTDKTDLAEIEAEIIATSFKEDA